MDPFEEQLRDLSWKKPSKELRDRLFPPEEEETVVVRGAFRHWMPWAAAAAIVLSVGLGIHILRPVADAPLVTESEIAEPIEIEIASNETFFDFSVGTDDAWAGSLTMKVEAN